MRVQALLMVCLLGLGACSTTADADRCASFGYRRGTDAFAGCLERASIARGQAIGNALKSYGESRRAMTPIQPITLPADRVVCTHLAYGQIVCRAQ